MTCHKLPTQSRLLELLDYDKDSGNFTWIKSPRRGVAPGSIAGTPTTKGYRHIMIDRRRYFAHRLAWLYVYGEDPGDLQLDHINRVRSDNRIDNLRLATQSENGLNRTFGTDKSTL
jgi:hypothetical protein